MRYVAPQFVLGRIGHQFTVAWHARLVADLFGLEYLHVPFRDHEYVSGGCARGTPWNDFLGLGRGVTALSTVAERLGRLTYKPTPRFELEPARFGYEETWRLIDALPDEHVLLYEDLAPIDYWRVMDWVSRGLIASTNTQATAAWFQQQLHVSPDYVSAPVMRAGYTVAAYRRTPIRHEQLPASHTPASVSYFNEALAKIKQRYAVETAVLYTQQLLGDEPLLDAAWDVRVVADEYPATLHAFKTLVEADVAITSTGSTAAIVQLYRFGRLPTVTCQPWRNFPSLAVGDIVRDLP